MENYLTRIAINIAMFFVNLFVRQNCDTLKVIKI